MYLSVSRLARLPPGVSSQELLELLSLDAMALLLDLWSALLLGILYLTFQAFPIIFGQVHHFSLQTTGLTFLGIGLGMMFGLATQPLFNRSVFSVIHSS